ncbi:hypothetical protein, partial [Promicromonospora kroppenstedtii]|uniref:hypothetical protein n=1 Tax=Promicromonospora kroppenstedtii TaxID=440482 RepID=UPI0005600031
PPADDDAGSPAALAGSTGSAADVAVEQADEMPAGKAEQKADAPEGGKKPADNLPVIDENFDFKALSFAAISAAHKKALGPRTVTAEDETVEDGADATASAASPAEASAGSPAEPP